MTRARRSPIDQRRRRATAVRLAAALLAIAAIVIGADASGATTTSARAAGPTPPQPTGPVQTGPVVAPNRQVTFSLDAPDATTVMLNLQNSTGPAPAADAIAMTKAPDGVWSVTIGPEAPGYYGYGFIVDGVQIPDPGNHNVWVGAGAAWSNVFVPGPAAGYMADRRVPHGAWSTVEYFSRLTHTERQMIVYTPPGYGRGTRPYPVLYLMHGGGGNDTDWIDNMRANYIMDNLISEHRARPMIIVMPDGNVQPSFTLGSPVTSDEFPRELIGSIVPYVDSHYRVLPGADNRALAGLSLGGIWTLDTLMTHPGEFGDIGVFSSGWNDVTRANLVTRHRRLLANPSINRRTKLLWITVGDQRDIAYDNNFATLSLFRRFHIHYHFRQGTGGHVWNTWRHDLLAFAPRLFR